MHIVLGEGIDPNLDEQGNDDIDTAAHAMVVIGRDPGDAMRHWHRRLEMLRADNAEKEHAQGI